MKKLPALLLLSAALPAFSFAQVLVNDTFSDGGRTNGADVQDAAWFHGSNEAPASVGVVDVGGNNRLRISAALGSALNPLLTSTFAPAALSVGQTISLSFDFTSTTAASASGIRFGLYNGGSTNITADIMGNPPAFGSVFHDDVGFSAFAPHQQTGTIQLYNRTANTTSNANLLGGATAINSPIVGASATLGTATNTTSVYSVGLALTRTVAGYDYLVSYAGTSFGGSTTLVPTSSFDTIGILAINDSQTFTIDNVMVSVTSIPEPSTWAAISGLAALGAVAARRRRSAAR